MISKFKKSFILVFAVANMAFGQVFIPVDKDTNEFVDSVNFSLFKNKKLVYNGVTLSGQGTKIDGKTEFDSISFSREDYEILGLLKNDIDSIVFLSKKIIYLNEVVINRDKEKSVVLGEANRFVKSQSRPISKELIYGVVLGNCLQERLELDKIVFYIGDVAFKTAYKINFSEVKEDVPRRGSQFAETGSVIYSSDALYVTPKDDKRIEVKLPPELFLASNKQVFVWIQLLGYYDKAGQELDPKPDDMTKLKFQLSDRANFYSKMSDFYTKELSPELVNVNIRINYDFANSFFKKPHKSILVTPAIQLYGKKK